MAPPPMLSQPRARNHRKGRRVKRGRRRKGRAGRVGRVARRGLRARMLRRKIRRRRRIGGRGRRRRGRGNWRRRRGRRRRGRGWSRCINLRLLICRRRRGFMGWRYMIRYFWLLWLTYPALLRPWKHWTSLISLNRRMRARCSTSTPRK